MIKYKLMFSKTRHAEFGKMKLFKFGVSIMRWAARSGQAWDQKDFWNRGSSPIPPSTAISSDKGYKVNLNEYCPGNTNAMGDHYYHIEPDPIVSNDGNNIREEIGIHSDENFFSKPGSAGCIVMMPEVFASFHQVMQAIKKQEKTDYLPLEVVYF